jgi:hypothetical protein
MPCFCRPRRCNAVQRAGQAGGSKDRDILCHPAQGGRNQDRGNKSRDDLSARKGCWQNAFSCWRVFPTYRSKRTVQASVNRVLLARAGLQRPLTIL